MTDQFISTFNDVELKNLIRECITEAVADLNFKKGFDALKDSKIEVLSRKETTELLDISLPTLHS